MRWTRRPSPRRCGSFPLLHGVARMRTHRAPSSLIEQQRRIFDQMCVVLLEDPDAGGFRHVTARRQTLARMRSISAAAPPTSHAFAFGLERTPRARRVKTPAGRPKSDCHVLRWLVGAAIADRSMAPNPVTHWPRSGRDFKLVASQASAVQIQSAHRQLPVGVTCQRQLLNRQLLLRPSPRLSTRASLVPDRMPPRLAIRKRKAVSSHWLA